MGRSQRKKLGDSRLPSSFKIQITSMVDMFVIILVFMIKSYSTSSVQVTPNDDLRLPSSTSMAAPKDVLKLMVSKKGIFVEDTKVVDLVDGKFLEKDLSKEDSSVIEGLYKALDAEAKKTEEISKRNAALKFTGEVLMQADKDLPYEILEKVMYTAMAAGYPDLKLAVVSQ